ncbi:uncharacterized protein LACBIDRAFT_303981 [Laccaria bicolor S238N-H82]|uniref:Predicted protein n=1 Tax=Laccaria bicolor (strain S238N-H82 / ATCC MYA-4686) TaxID=486041 RepID=B0DKP4_LACBS|nr:uncharacterized protein LACBIDRAFT_303981 [Laccaria bicolor S238N-H82]EDR04681.1 predicted protein [Laccaria bicolor S238N-H82]|eukprot:XP_001884505.1 predicted protein [Laccaria bicolor S238N-H82]
MSNRILEDFKRATTRLNSVISASSPKLKRADAKKAEWAIISEVLDKWIGTVETATEHQLRWPKNLMPSWMATLRSRTWLTQPALTIIDQRFSRCANKIAVVVPLSQIIDLEFDDSEDGEEGQEEVVEGDAPGGAGTSSNSNSRAAKKEKEKAPPPTSSHQVKREPPVFKPNIHKLNDPRCHRCSQAAVPRMCFSEKSLGSRCERCIHLKQACSLTKKVPGAVQQAGGVAQPVGDLGKGKRKAIVDAETRKVRQRLSGSGSGSRTLDNSSVSHHSMEDTTPRAGPSSHRRKTSALTAEAEKLRNDLRILIGGVAMVGKMLNKHIAELEALAKRPFGEESEGEGTEFED